MLRNFFQSPTGNSKSASRKKQLPAVDSVIHAKIEQEICRVIENGQETKNLPPEQKQRIFAGTWEKYINSGFLDEVKELYLQDKMRREREAFVSSRTRAQGFEEVDPAESKEESEIEIAREEDVSKSAGSSLGV